MRNIISKVKRKINVHLETFYQYFQFRLSKRIIIGSAGISYPGWLLTDKDTLDITKRTDFTRYWKTESRVMFLAEHVSEHLKDTKAKIAATNCFGFLKRGGRLRIAVPDGFNPDQAIELIQSYGPGPGTCEHKCIYNYRSLTTLLKNAGFDTTLLEFYDEKGKFHFNEWSSIDGHIVRSKRYDPRNKDGKLQYTSLIVDAIKP